MENILDLAAANQQRAREVIRDTGLEAAWRAAGAEPNLVGSLRTGLLMKHRDIDFHIYSPSLNIADSFAAMTRIAANPRIRRIEYGNLLDTSEEATKMGIVTDVKQELRRANALKVSYAASKSLGY